jgi:hypothetical protein
MTAARKLRAAEVYLALGWQLFTVQGDNKRPWRSCDACRPPAPMHSGADCDHLMCHAFYAATSEVSQLEKMFTSRPGAQLALRTGAPSGVVVVDAEGSDDGKGDGRTGVETLEDWDWWGDTLKARTGGGGLHLFYAYDPANGKVTSRNRVASNIDIKGEGGYVVLSPAEGRTWMNWTQKEGSADVPCAELFSWLTKSKGSSSGRRTTGAPVGAVPGVSPLPGEMVPAGVRYEFTQKLVYKLRKQDLSWDEAWCRCREWWERYEQPPVAEYELPWRQVEYELERAWTRVEPEPSLPDKLFNWMKGLQDGN